MTAPRPALDAVRFRKFAAMLSSPHEGERHSALAKANAMLEAAGLTWIEVLDGKRAGGDAVRGVGPQPAPTTYADAFEGIFSEFRSRTGGFGQRAEPAPRPPRSPLIRQGGEIPRHLHGTVTVSDRRTTSQGKPMLVVTVEGEDGDRATVDGPMMVFHGRSIEAIDAMEGRPASFTVKQPGPSARKGRSPILRVDGTGPGR